MPICCKLCNIDACMMVLMLRSYVCCNNNARCASVTRAGLTGTTCLIQTQAVSSCRPFVGLPFTLRQQKRRRSGPQSLQAYAGLLSIFRPTKQSTNKSQAAELVTEILHIASQTNSGATASQEQCKEIRRLVRDSAVVSTGSQIYIAYNNPCICLSQAEQLQQVGGVRDPVYSKLTWGNYEVTR